MAALDGIRQTGVPVTVDGCDVTDRRMHLRLYSPAVQAMAPHLLANYRSPFDGRAGADLPVVWGGFLITNSETGCGAFTITPRLMVQVCRNGLVIDHRVGLRARCARLAARSPRRSGEHGTPAAAPGAGRAGRARDPTGPVKARLTTWKPNSAGSPAPAPPGNSTPS
jgi:hypothetical protein